MTTPLAGIKVLDLTRYQSGPACTVQLADLGAEVLKVELPGRGDEGRGVFPIEGEEVNPYFLSMNHGKRGITVNYRTPEGLALLHRLGAGCDVVVENFRPGAADGMKVGYEDFKRHNPKIVYASISAFGERGPLRDQAGFDIHGQAMGGLMSTTGAEGDAYPVGAAIGDQMAGLTMTTAILAALVTLERTGIGQRVAVSLYGCQVALQAWEISYYAMSRQLPGKALNSHPIIAGAGAVWGAYPTKDGHIALGVLGPVQWRRFCEGIGMEDDGEEEGEFMRDASERQDEIREKLAARTTAEWLEVLRAADIHVGRVNTYADILADPQARENGYITSIQGPDGRSYDLVGSAIQFSETPPDISQMPPGLGEHTEQVLREFGLDAVEIARLRDAELI